MKTTNLVVLALSALAFAGCAKKDATVEGKTHETLTLEAPGATSVTVLEGGGLIVELVHNPSASPRAGASPDLVHGPYKAGFVVKDFGRTVETLRARGVDIAFGPFPARDGQRANVIVRDDAGNLLQIFGD